MEDEDVVMQLLISLPDSYDHVASALENLAEKELTLERVKARLLEEELKRKFKATSVADQQSGAAFNAKNNQKKSRITPKCFHCHEVGHKRPDCPQRNKKKKNAQTAKTKSDGGFNMISEIVTGAMSVRKADGECRFVLDSGCTYHMIKDENLLVDVRTLEHPFHVNIADKDSMLIVKKAGHVPISTVIERREAVGTLNDVLLIPGLRCNLMYVIRIV